MGPGEQGRVLFVGRESSFGQSLERELQSRAYAIAKEIRGDEGLARITKEPFDLVISESELEGFSGIELLKRTHVEKPALPVILLTEQINSAEAIEASRHSVFEYFQKPVDMPELMGAVAKATERNGSQPIVARNGHEFSSMPGIVGRGRAMQKLYKDIGKAAACSAPVLICGATGTGKELVAKAIHQSSARATHPFLAMNCAAIPETLFEAEVFGHEAGSFTGAAKRRVGLFEHAQRGTLFLDEIGELSLLPQAKLLRVLEDKSLRRVGGNERISLDVRVLAATNRDLQAGIEEKQFREDLFYRLNAVVIQVPELAQRTEDIPELVTWFMYRSKEEAGVAEPSIQPGALEFLQNRTWKGNVRELESVVRRAVLQAGQRPINLGIVREACEHFRKPRNESGRERGQSLTDLLERARAGEVSNVRDKVVELAERDMLTRAMEYARGNQAKVSRWLGMTRATIRKKLRTFGFKSMEKARGGKRNGHGIDVNEHDTRAVGLYPPKDQLTMH